MKRTAMLLTCATSAACLLAACGNTPQANAPTARAKPQPTQHPVPTHLDFTRQQGTPASFEMDGQTVRYRAFENIVYVLKPVDTRYQVMNIYVPEAYFQGGSVGGFSVDSAPIFLPQQHRRLHARHPRQA